MEIPKPNFIQRLQALDDGPKQKVLIGTSIVVMIVVIYFWLAYFNGIVAGGAGQSQAVAVNDDSAVSAATTAPVASGPSFWDQAKQQLSDIYKTVTNPGQYQVSGQSK